METTVHLALFDPASLRVPACSSARRTRMMQPHLGDAVDGDERRGAALTFLQGRGDCAVLVQQADQRARRAQLLRRRQAHLRLRIAFALCLSSILTVRMHECASF